MRGNATFETAELLTVRDLARVLSLTPDTIRRAVKAGAIPALRIGGAIRFNADQVAAITRDGFSWPDQAASTTNAS